MIAILYFHGREICRYTLDSEQLRSTMWRTAMLSGADVRVIAKEESCHS